MADLYASYTALAAGEIEGVDYTRTVSRPAGVAWASIAIHGGGIEVGSGEMARRVAELRGMAYYEFAGIQLSNNFADLHITSSAFDEPQCVALVGASSRTISFHGMSGTAGVSETLIGGLDAALRDRIKAALIGAGFTVSVAASELAGTDPTNICNKNASGAGVQLEMSSDLRASFFPGGDTSRAMRDSGQRTAVFEAYAAAVASVLTPTLTYDGTLSRVRLASTVPGLVDTFSRTVSNDWGDTESGQAWMLVGTTTAFQVTGGVGQHIQTAVNVSRWSLAAVKQADWDLYASVATDRLASGNSEYAALVGRSSDDGASCYLARVELSATQQVILTIRKRVAGTETFLVQFTTALTHATGAAVRVRFQGVGTALKAKAWSPLSAEPADWQLSTTDTSVTGSGRLGVRSILSSAYAGTLPVSYSWDDITTAGTAVVERGDGVRWSTIRGGTGLPTTAALPVARDDYEFTAGALNQYRVRVYEPLSGATLWTAQDSLTPTPTSVWLKSIIRPFLNVPLRIKDYSDTTRTSRSGMFQVVGRSYPVAVTDISGARQWTLQVYVDTDDQAESLDILVATGDVLLVHVPKGQGRISTTPGGYVVVGNTRTTTLPTTDLALRVVEIPCTEVAAPGPDVVGGSATWATFVNTYVTVPGLLADGGPTWADALDLVGSRTDVVVL